MKTVIEGTIGPFFAEAREKDLNDSRVLESTMMDELARGQIWVTRCKIDDKTDRTLGGALFSRNCVSQTNACPFMLASSIIKSAASNARSRSRLPSVAFITSSSIRGSSSLRS